ncbi:MAG: hypothetical protein HY790_04630 [Deltaproteobacteria bacterium]|nr:hypothetical protein [Deltaproteobacteria bacterium]
MSSTKDKKFRVEINLNVTIYNYRSLLDRILWIIDTFNPNDINLCPIYDVKELQLSSKDVGYYYKKVYPEIENLCKKNKFTQLPVRAYLLFGQNEGKNYLEGNRYYVSHEANCYAGSANIFIDNFGKIYPCVSHQVHRFMDNHICLGTLQKTDYITKLIIDKKTPCYNPNDNKICRNYCPIFFGRVNKYIDFLIQGER